MKLNIEKKPIAGANQEVRRKRGKKISALKRLQLLEMIFFQNKKIKRAAEELNINYSSAKTILHLYRQKSKKKGGMDPLLRCGTRPAMIHSNKEAKPLQIVISHGGRPFCKISTATQSLDIVPLTSKMSTSSSDGMSSNEDFTNYQQQSIYPHTELDIAHLSALFDLSTESCHDLTRSTDEIHTKTEVSIRSFLNIEN